MHTGLVRTHTHIRTGLALQLPFRHAGGIYCGGDLAIHIYIYIYIHTYIYIYTHTYIRTCIPTYLHTQIHTSSTHTDAHTCITYKHTYRSSTHTHTHVRTYRSGTAASLSIHWRHLLRRGSCLSSLFSWTVCKEIVSKHVCIK
jgi:hypothetical protein